MYISLFILHGITLNMKHENKNTKDNVKRNDLYVKKRIQTPERIESIKGSRSQDECTQITSDPSQDRMLL